VQRRDELLVANRAWAARMRERDPEFFSRLSHQQAPEFLWIGCSDSRVPANQITGLEPGEVFVHRNVANLVPGEDLNSHSVIQYAVEALNVRHIIVCGHYGCGGIIAALKDERLGLVDYWLTGVRTLRDRYRRVLDAQPTEAEQVAMLCELNVIEQVMSLSRTLVVRRAWEAGRELFLNGWVYSLEDGLLRDLDVTANSVTQAEAGYLAAQQRYTVSH
jgi:carbonic anhydrase